MEAIKSEDYANTKNEYIKTIRMMAKASIHDSFRSLVFANDSLSLGLQAFGVDAAEEVATAMEVELEKILEATNKRKKEDSSQISMNFYPKTGEKNEYQPADSGCS